MKRFLPVLKWLWLLPLMVLACGRPSEFEVVDFAGMQWYKGNTHTHTTNSDGDSPPEVVARWYRDHGYNFLVLSDHNFLTDPAALYELNTDSFLLIAGEEVSARYGGKPVHVNGLNISRVVPPASDSSLTATIQANVDAVREADGVPHINHPNFRWAFSYRELLRIQRDRLLEIYNAHPLVNNLGGGGWPGMEEVWDRLLTAGKRLYGIAVDDAHDFQKFGPMQANPGRAWVVVRAPELTASAIVESLERGRFYASTGVELDKIRVAPRRLEIRIRQRHDFKYRTRFIGDGGRVLLQTGDNPAVYELRHRTRYVRAKVIESTGAVAWVQPVFVK